jgi:glycosyltransferase involved in cell wall biosynthesis
MAMIGTLLHEIRHFDPDVIHFQHGHLWFNFAWPLLRRYPLVVTIHEVRHHLGDRDSQRTPQAIMDLGYRQADQVIVHGEQIRQEVVKHLHLPAEHIHVVPPVPDIVLPARTSSGSCQHDRQHILFFGRIWAYKGLEYLIRAEPLITSQVPHVRIVIAGRGEDFARYRRMMVHPEHFIVHNEYIPDDKLIDLFREASIVVLPYVDGSISGVVAVAGTFGKPVVATTVGILPEMIDDGRTGLLVPPRDEKALAAALVRLLRDERLRDELGRGAKRKVETTFSPYAVARQTLRVYERTIASTTSR